MITWRRKGEWLEWGLDFEPQSVGEIVDRLPMELNDKWFGKLQRSGGVEWKGRKFRLRLFPEESTPTTTEWAEADVLYEDDFCLVAGKPAGMKVHPTQEGETGTLLQAVGWHLNMAGELCRPRHIHRLDEDTTGPVLFAKYEWAQLQLDAAMREKKVERIYVALVHGLVNPAQGTVEQPIGRDRHHATRRRVSQTGEAAVTHYEVIERLRSASLVRLRLETGRTHQIRVHMSHLGHPLIGDTLYGGQTQGIKRQALHGERLLFGHPLTGEAIEVNALWPDDFHALYNGLKK